MDQSSFAAPHGLSQRITSFFACACQGIHQMPLRHLIAFITNAHHSVSRSSERPTDRGYLLQPSQFNNAIDVRSGPYRSYAEQLQGRIIKTSFSRSNPVPRGQATVIRPSVRGAKRHQQQTIQSDKPSSRSLFAQGQLDHPRLKKQDWLRTWIKNPT